MTAALNAFFDALFSPLEALPAELVLALVSLATALFLLAVFRFTSNQEGIRRARGRLIAQLLAIRLFPDDPMTTLRCLGGALRANAGYLRHSLIPLLVLLPPMAILLLQLELRFAHLPLEEGASTTASITFRPGALASAALPPVGLAAAEGLEVETPPLPIPCLAEVDWRIRARRSGVHALRFELEGAGAGAIEKEVVIGGRELRRLASARTGGGLLERLLHLGEPPLAAELGIAEIRVDYPPRPFRLLGMRMHWLVAFFILSLAFAFLLKKPLGVEV
jgi:hypothetical protein